MEIAYDDDDTSLNYHVNLKLGLCSFWAYPAPGENECVISPDLPTPCEYADPPSHELRTLIEVAAPWYVVIDKLIEEYPQWQSHFEAAAAVEWERQRLAHPTPESASTRS